MNKELTKALQEKYPTFFRDLYGDPRKSCLAFGIECGDGWHGLLSKLCEDIAALNPVDFCFAQIKEKFGSLTIYADGKDAEVFRLISDAERESYKVCEDCGTRDDVTTEGSWVLTLCKTCRKKHD